MKQYKIGDTIYAKGTVRVIDDDDKKLPYYVDFGNTGWIPSDNIIDELPTSEPVKPVLPKAVADELEDAKKSAYNFFGFLRDCNNKTYPETCHFMFYDTVSSDKQIKILSDAWYNGYTVEKPKLYNLVFGFDSNDHRSAFYKGFRGVIINADTSIGDLDDLHYQFTQEQIDKYNEDFWIKNLDLNDYKVEVEE